MFPEVIGRATQSKTASASSNTAARAGAGSLRSAIAGIVATCARRHLFNPGQGSLDLGARSKVYDGAVSLTVAQLAGRTGLSADTVRYYERAGLLPVPQRSRAGYRLYDERLIDRLRFIKGAQRTGLKLRQIRELLEITDRGSCPCGHTDALLRTRIGEIDREIAELKQIRTQLAALRDQLPETGNRLEPSEEWPCERAFIEAGSIDGRRTKP